MQSLGLSSEPKRTDGWFRSLLWPRVENAWDVDYLGQQGMWICTLLALFALLSSVFTANAIAIFIGVLSALFFVLGGMGVRQANWPAAGIVFAVEFLDIVFHIVTFKMPSVFSILFAVVLLSNVRAAFLASEWKPAADGEDRPTRFSETLADKYVDQMPAKLWPILQIPFLIAGITVLLLSVVAIAYAMAPRFGLLPHR